jgi:uncharacterized protein (DUF2141 family)
MRARLRSRTFVVVSFVLLSVLAFAQASQQSPPPKPTGLVVGQVIDAGSMKPIPAATVVISGGNATTGVTLPTGEFIVQGDPSAGAPAPRQVIADGAGRFMFRELGSGAYTLRASSPGYSAGVFGQNRPGGASQPLVLEREDERRGGVVIKMWRNGVLSGRVVDEVGEPMIGMQVRILRRTIAGGRLRLSQFNTVQTDDRGVYRVSVAPADYVLGVMSVATTLPASTSDTYYQGIVAGGGPESLISEYSMSGAPFPSASGFRIGQLIYQTEGGRGGSGTLPPPGEDGRVVAYSSMFYQAAGSPTEATVVKLASGEERTGLDFQLKLKRTLIVSGTVTGPDGPVKNVGVKLLPAGADAYSSPFGTEAAVTASDAAGSFTFLGVPPGTYTLQVVRVPRFQAPRSPSSMTTVEIAGAGGMSMGFSSSGPTTGPSLPLPTDPTLWGGMQVTVGEVDVANLSVVLKTGAKLSGKIVFEGNGTPPPADVVQRISLQISPVAAMPSQVSGAQKRVEGDGRFATVGYPPGRYTFSASVPQVPQQSGGTATVWRFKSASNEGRNLDEGFEIQSSDIAGLVVTFTDRSTEISGMVMDLKSQADAGALVVVMPADSQAWRESITPSRRVRSARTTTTGSYSLKDLPPGEYFIAAVSDGAVDNWQEPRTLDSISRVATRITLGEGGTVSQRLTTAVIR